MFKAAKLRQYFGIDKKSSPTKRYTKHPKTAENQAYTPNVNRFVYISPCPNFISNSFQGLFIIAMQKKGGMQRESTSPHLL
jgi:hypothetical protein